MKMNRAFAVLAFTAGTLGLAPAAFADGLAGASVTQFGSDGALLQTAAAGAVGDGTVFAGAAINESHTGGGYYSAGDTDISINAVGLSTDGDLNGNFENIGSLTATRSNLSKDQIGDGVVEIHADVDVNEKKTNVDVNAIDKDPNTEIYVDIKDTHTKDVDVDKYVEKTKVDVDAPDGYYD